MRPGRVPTCVQGMKAPRFHPPCWAPPAPHRPSSSSSPRTCFFISVGAGGGKGRAGYVRAVPAHRSHRLILARPRCQGIVSKEKGTARGQGLAAAGWPRGFAQEPAPHGGCPLRVPSVPAALARAERHGAVHSSGRAWSWDGWVQELGMGCSASWCSAPGTDPGLIP